MLHMTPSCTVESSLIPLELFSSVAYRLMSISFLSLLVLVIVLTASMVMSLIRSLHLAMILMPTLLWMTFLTLLGSSRSILGATVSSRRTAAS